MDIILDAPTLNAILVIVMTNPLAQRLGVLALNEYEARVYLALIGADALTAYELGKRAGVPLSRCYEIARALARKGLALVQPGETPRYRAVDPDLAIESQRRELESLGSALRAHALRDDSEPAWILRGRGLVLATAYQLIESASREVALWCPADAHATLAAPLAGARSRGLSVETALAGGLVLLVDRAEALLGELDPPERVLATHLRQPAVVACLAARVHGRTDESETPVSEAAWLDWESHKVRRLLATVPGLVELDAT